MFRGVLVVALIFGSAGCGSLGFRDRVLWRIPSPNGHVLAVCQEVPIIDGPGYDVRLERPDGTLLRRLYEIGDGDPCSEMAWSPDGRTLAVLSGHVARVRFVDVAWALDHPSTTTKHWSWRQVDFSSDQRPVEGSSMRFTGPLEVELQLCPYKLDTARRNGRRTCTEPASKHRFEVPLAIATGHPADIAQRRGRAETAIPLKAPFNPGTYLAGRSPRAG